MNYRIYGEENSRTVILLHGGGLSWWNFRDAAELLQTDFRVVLPFLDGHAGSDSRFTTIENNAAAIISMIQDQFGSSVELIGGLSLGAQILLEMLAQQGDICRHALIESAMVIPSRLTNLLIKPSLDCSYGLIRRRWFSRLQFRSLHMRDDYFSDYFRDTVAIQKSDYIAVLQANTSYALKPALRDCPADVRIFVGVKEPRSVRRSAERIRDALPHAQLSVLAGYRHGDFSLHHAQDYAHTVSTLCACNI